MCDRKTGVISNGYSMCFLISWFFAICVPGCFGDNVDRRDDHVETTGHEDSSTTIDKGTDDSAPKDSDAESTGPVEQIDDSPSNDIETAETITEISDTCWDTDCSTDPHFCYTLSVDECEDNDCIIERGHRVDEDAKCTQRVFSYVCREPALCTQEVSCMYSPDGELFEFSQGCNMKYWTGQPRNDCLDYRFCDDEGTDPPFHDVK